MLFDLGGEDSLDPGRAGSKAAWLARARRAGLPVLPGLVVPAPASLHHMAVGAGALAARGSGGARLAVMAEPLPFAAGLVEAARSLGDALVARSSTALEQSGQWSGAFTSYLDLSPEDLPKAVAGCWASAFSVDSLERQRTAGVEPGSFPMAVLVQPALAPEAGGVASIDRHGVVTVQGVEGSPAPLLQGWSGAAVARHDGSWQGEELIDLVGPHHLDALAATLRTLQTALGADRMEWALDAGMWVLQVGGESRDRMRPPPPPAMLPPDPVLLRVARALLHAPGRLGEELVLPWALGGLPVPGAASPSGSPEPVALRARASQLAAQVWDLPAEEALRAARATFDELLGPEPGPALARIRSLSRPDRAEASALLADLDQHLGVVAERNGLSHRGLLWHRPLDRPAEPDVSGGSTGRRVGLGRWEPFLAAVAFACGAHHQGTPAGDGVGAGPAWRVSHPARMGSPPPRQVVVAARALPNAAPLLWDAAGLVTETGSPGAHLFESARSLGVPAVCGLEMPDDQDVLVAVDGYTGVVATAPIGGGEDE